MPAAAPSIVSSPAAERKPSVYLFYGDHDFAVEQALNSLKANFADAASAELNLERFDGANLVFGRLVEVATSAPFLAERRLVIIHQADQLTRRKDDRQQFLEFLPGLPPTTALVLVEQVDLSRRRALGRYQQRSHLYRWANDHPDLAYVQKFSRPYGSAFVKWLRDRSVELGGEIAPPAAQLLAEFVADDPHLAAQELTKLLDYVDRARPIEAEDVRRLTPLYGQSDVFAMVDAVGQRDGSQALAHLHRLLAQEDPRYAFAMIVRQFRLLLQARESLDLGLNPEQTMDVPNFVARKAAAQARTFPLPQLEALHHQLLQLDLDSKLGRADLATAMDQLILSLAVDATR